MHASLVPSSQLEELARTGPARRMRFARGAKRANFSPPKPQSTDPLAPERGIRRGPKARISTQERGLPLAGDSLIDPAAMNLRLGLAPANDSLSGMSPSILGDDRTLPFVPVALEVDDYPIANTAELVSSIGV